jgi:hypothetical protein
MNKLTKAIDNTYEAAYYFLHGAKVIDAKVLNVAKNKTAKKMLKHTWVIRMSDIPEACVERWQIGNAMCHVKQLADARTKVKRKVHQILDAKYEKM